MLRTTKSWAVAALSVVADPAHDLRGPRRTEHGGRFNLAHAGATVDDLIGQARTAVALKPQPQLFLVQIMDNDIVCPANAGDYAGFLGQFLTAMEKPVPREINRLEAIIHHYEAQLVRAAGGSRGAPTMVALSAARSTATNTSQRTSTTSRSRGTPRPPPSRGLRCHGSA